MKNFGYMFLACITAIFASGILLFILSLLFMVGMVASMSTRPQVSQTVPGSILRINLDGHISDNPSSHFIDSFDPYTLTVTRSVSMLQIITAIERAKDDNNIKGIYLNINPGTDIGLANAEEIRNALDRFNDNGKFIISYADWYSQLSYYLSSVADRVYLNPEGDLEWRGMSSQVMFFKGALDKLGIKAEIFRSGDFKSAVEPFMYESMSPENREQTSRLVNSIWGGMVAQVAQSREIDSAVVQQYASDLAIRGAVSAVRYGLIDGAVHTDYVEERLAGFAEINVDDLKLVPLPEYIWTGEALGTKHSRNKIAVIYAEGDIVDGGSRDGEVDGHELAKQLHSARMDDNVKAVVLRINSPGGSALASEVIWNEMSLLRDNKTVVVSMGNYAASGGYYIAAPADMILAGKYTVTGSIGVFGLMINAEKALREKLGITVDIVRTNPSADLGTPFRGQTAAEREYFQDRVEDVYYTFVNHVSDGRNLSSEEVHKIAGGRVWSGADSFDLGLVDGHGGLNDAIAIAASKAGVANNFTVDSGPGYYNPLSDIISNLFKGSLFTKKDSPADELVKEYDLMMRMVQREGIHAAIPYRMIIE